MRVPISWGAKDMNWTLDNDVQGKDEEMDARSAFRVNRASSTRILSTKQQTSGCANEIPS